MESLPQPACWCAADAIYMNPAMEELIGYTNKEITTVLMWFQTIFTEDWQTVYNQVYLPVKDENFPDVINIPLVDKLGLTHQVSFTGHKNGDEEVWLMTDLTSEKNVIATSAYEVKNLANALVEIRNLQFEISQENEKLKKSNQELEDFAYVASHDLKEPIRKIVAFSDRLKKKYGGQLDETATFYLERMESAGTRMQTLIDDLLEYSRVSRNQVDKERVDMKMVFDTIVDRLEGKINEKNATIELLHLEPIYASPSLITSLFQNLIHNAMKFVEENKVPKVTIDSKKVVVKNKNYVMYTVQDNGIGIDKRFSIKIFNIFERLHSKDNYKGTGIGLAIVRRIVEKHNGLIHVLSDLGKGSIFQVYIPQENEGKAV